MEFRIVELSGMLPGEVVPHDVFQGQQRIAHNVGCVEAYELVDSMVRLLDTIREQYRSGRSIRVSGEEYLADREKDREFFEH